MIGRMDATAPFQVTPPRAQTGTDMPRGGLTASVSETGNLALDGDPMTLSELLSASEAALSENLDLRIRINADGATALRHVLPLIEMLKANGADNIVLVVSPDAG